MKKTGGEAVGGLIRKYRNQKGISQMALAERVGISYQQIQKYERGISKITIDRLEEIAEALGLTVQHFIETDREKISEETPPYTGISADEELLLRLYRNMTDSKLKKVVLKIMRAMTE